MAKQPKFRLDGELDGRGHADASKSTRFATDDGRKRPGRKKGARDEKTEILAIRDMLVEVTIGDKKQKVPTRTAIFLRQRKKALDGDQRATEFLDAKFSQYEPPLLEPNLTSDLLAEDQAILESAVARGLIDRALLEGSLSSPSNDEDGGAHR